MKTESLLLRDILVNFKRPISITHSTGMALENEIGKAVPLQCNLDRVCPHFWTIRQLSNSLSQSRVKVEENQVPKSTNQALQTVEAATSLIHLPNSSQTLSISLSSRKHQLPSCPTLVHLLASAWAHSPQVAAFLLRLFESYLCKESCSGPLLVTLCNI